MSKRKETYDGYVCGTTAHYELGQTHIRVYPSIEGLKQYESCWPECGIFKLKIQRGSSVVDGTGCLRNSDETVVMDHPHMPTPRVWEGSFKQNDKIALYHPIYGFVWAKAKKENGRWRAYYRQKAFAELKFDRKRNYWMGYPFKSVIAEADRRFHEMRKRVE